MKNGFLIVLLIFTLSNQVLAMCGPGVSGGDPCFVYVNDVFKYKLEYPQYWQLKEQDNNITISNISITADSDKSSFVHIEGIDNLVDEHNSENQNMDRLLIYLKEQYPNTEWQEIRWNQMPGYRFEITNFNSISETMYLIWKNKVFFISTLKRSYANGVSDSDGIMRTLKGINVQIHNHAYVVFSSAKTCAETLDPLYTGDGSIESPRTRFSKVNITITNPEYIRINRIIVKVTDFHLGSEYKTIIDGNELDLIFKMKEGCPYDNSELEVFPKQASSGKRYAKCADINKIGQIDENGLEIILPEKIILSSRDNCSITAGSLPLINPSEPFLAHGSFETHFIEMNRNGKTRNLSVDTPIVIENLTF